LVVTPALRTVPGVVSAGRLAAGTVSIRCALGVRGIVHDKREGDGRTPAGRFRLLGGFFRADRLRRPKSALFFTPLRHEQGWCDDPSTPTYNRPVRLPFPKRHETMWRGDRLYNVVIVLNYNINPRHKNRGSAIFLHIANEYYDGTAGCIAISPKDMQRLLPRLAPDCILEVR
jgi:L,D-peptidoglycan transpeptidase YkuD (ErfK/YbiS/YcfS/YnhG family)